MILKLVTCFPVLIGLFGVLTRARHFIRTCSNISFDDNYFLFANCTTKRGLTVTSKLDLDLCFAEKGGALVSRHEGENGLHVCPACALQPATEDGQNLACYCTTNMLEYTLIDIGKNLPALCE
jgi:hypothetical protein